MLQLAIHSRKGELLMSLNKSWCTIGETTSRYGLRAPLIMQWVENGVVRAEQADTRLMRVNIYDIEHRVLKVTGI